MQDSYDTIPAQDSEDSSYPKVNESLQKDAENTALENSITSDSNGPKSESEDTGIEEIEVGKGEEIDYSRIAAEDLSEIKRLFPEFSDLEDIRQLNNATRFGELRDAGLSVSEALAATNMDRMMTSLAQKIARSDGKSHLRSAVPVASSVHKNRMSAEELHSARELFGSLSDRELEHLYKRATS